jgi:hypothetical protein
MPLTGENRQLTARGLEEIRRPPSSPITHLIYPNLLVSVVYTYVQSCVSVPPCCRALQLGCPSSLSFASSQSLE